MGKKPTGNIQTKKFLAAFDPGNFGNPLGAWRQRNTTADPIRFEFEGRIFEFDRYDSKTKTFKLVATGEYLE